MKKIIFTLTVILMAMTSNAQIENSGNIDVGKNYSRIDLNFSLYSLSGKNTSDSDYDSNSGKNKIAPGVQIGYTYGINVTGGKLPLFIEVGGDLNYNRLTGYWFDYHGFGNDHEDSDCNYLSFDIPVNIAYNFTLPNNFWLEPYAGVNYKFNILANSHEDSYTYNMFKDVGTFMFKRFQFGGQFGIHAGYKHFCLNIGYQIETPISKSDDYFNLGKGQINTNKFTIGVGYTF